MRAIESAADGLIELADGLGERRLIREPQAGFLELLSVWPELVELATTGTRVGQQANRMEAAEGVVPCVHRVETHGAGMRVVAEHVTGVRLSTLISHMERFPGRVSHTAVMWISGALARAVAVVHQLPGTLVHGAISPEHVVLKGDGTVVLTDAVFADLLAGLEYSTRRYWSAFGLTLPSSATFPRFNQRADVMQMAGVILQLAVGRRLTAADITHLPELVATVTLPSVSDASDEIAVSAQFRAWLYRALQFPTRSGPFRCAVDAEAAVAGILEPQAPRQGLKLVNALVNELMVPVGTAPHSSRDDGHWVRTG